MKKIIYPIISLAVLLTSSCNDFLDDSRNESRTTGETVYSSVDFTQLEINSIYDRVADAQMYAQRISLNWSTNSDIEHVGASETDYNQNSNRGVSNYYATPGNNTLIWTRIYQMIERANLAIEGIPNSPIMTSGDRDKVMAMEALLGEALTLRALGYYELIKHWGDVPFKQEPTKSDLSNVYLPKMDRDSIYDYILEDLFLAEEYIPWIGQSAGSLTYGSAERVTKGFVKGLIARICLSRGGYSLRDKPGYPTERGDNWEHYYEIARQRCEEIITESRYQLKDYRQIWRDISALRADGTNGENMFEVALGLGQSGEIGYSIGVRFYKNAKYGYGNNSNVVNTSAYYYYSFDSLDIRKDATIAKATYSNSLGEQKEFFTSNPLSYNIAKWDQRWMAENSSWLAYNQAANGKWGYGVNWVVMRYSDIYLMYAEADNELSNGPTSKAKQYLKNVRRRAFAVEREKPEDPGYIVEKVDNYVDNLNTKEEFFDAIVNERAWEFGGEAIRKFDLIRWNLLMSKIQDQRDALYAMIDGAPAKVFDKTYNSLPENLYWKYEILEWRQEIVNNDTIQVPVYGENIAIDSTDFYLPNTELDALDASSLTARGYTKVAWMSNFSESNKTNYKNRIQVFSSGLKMENNGVCDNRHLYPIHSSVIGDYQGVIENSYGY